MILSNRSIYFSLNIHPQSKYCFFENLQINKLNWMKTAIFIKKKEDDPNRIILFLRLTLFWCLGPDSNRHGSYLPQDFKSCASAYSATQAKRLERKTGFEPATLALARRCSTPEPLPQLVVRDGIEPPTRGFSVLCSTN